MTKKEERMMNESERMDYYYTLSVCYDTINSDVIILRVPRSRGHTAAHCGITVPHRNEIDTCTVSGVHYYLSRLAAAGCAMSY